MPPPRWLGPTATDVARVHALVEAAAKEDAARMKQLLDQIHVERGAARGSYETALTLAAAALLMTGVRAEHLSGLVMFAPDGAVVQPENLLGNPTAEAQLRAGRFIAAYANGDHATAMALFTTIEDEYTAAAFMSAMLAVAGRARRYQQARRRGENPPNPLRCTVVDGHVEPVQDSP